MSDGGFREEIVQREIPVTARVAEIVNLKDFSLEDLRKLANAHKEGDFILDGEHPNAGFGLHHTYVVAKQSDRDELQLVHLLTTVMVEDYFLPASVANLSPAYHFLALTHIPNEKFTGCCIQWHNALMPLDVSRLPAFKRYTGTDGHAFEATWFQQKGLVCVVMDMEPDGCRPMLACYEYHSVSERAFKYSMNLYGRKPSPEAYSLLGLPVVDVVFIRYPKRFSYSSDFAEVTPESLDQDKEELRMCKEHEEK